MTALALENGLDCTHRGSADFPFSIYATKSINMSSSANLTCIKAPVISGSDSDDVARAHLVLAQMTLAQTLGFGFRRTIRYGASEANTLSGANPRSKT
jgi:hypothetical protein